MEWVILFFLAASIYLYALLGGADFGVGVHELFIDAKNKRKHEDVVKEAMGPVWEANHMWLIIVVVILFVGLPKVYSEVSIHLHIPLMLMLLGIILRGCAFSFRQYDAVEDGSRKYYSIVFSISSFLTPITLGIIIGALMLGRIQPEPIDYYSTYVAPWLNIFSLATGSFILSIFTFVAAVFMIGENNIGPFKSGYIKRAKICYVVMILSGGMVFIASHIDGLNLAAQFVSHPVALTAMSIATFCHICMWKYFNMRRAWRLRILTGFQLLMIITAWIAVTFPNVVVYADGTTLTVLDNLAPSSSQFALGVALLAGAGIFLPILFYLFFIFKFNRFHH